MSTIITILNSIITNEIIVAIIVLLLLLSVLLSGLHLRRLFTPAGSASGPSSGFQPGPQG